MDVDQARGDQVVFQVNHPGTLTGMEVSPDCGNLAVLDQDIAGHQLFTDQAPAILQ